jgi:hypothetical protein
MEISILELLMFPYTGFALIFCLAGLIIMKIFKSLEQ